MLAFLGWLLVFGLAVAGVRISFRFRLLCFIVFLVSLAAIGSPQESGDIDLTLLVQQVSFPGLDYLVTATNWLGQGTLRVMAVSLLVVALLFLTQFRAAALLVLVASLFRIVNPFVERILKSPRPTDDLVRVTEHATGFGFPSDHALGATLLFGSLAIAIPAMIKRRWLAISLQVLAGLMIVATGFGRVYTGAHWPTDVVGGILIGLVILHPLGWLYDRLYWQIQNQLIFVAGRR